MIPAHIIHLAQKNAQIMKCTVIVYKYHETYILLPIGYNIPVQAHMLGYITKDLVFVEKVGSDEAEQNTSNGSSENHSD